jgi:tRNA(Arg) A34 adenosine deaminase TadA
MASQVDEYFMGMAIRQAELAARLGEVPVGAVLVMGLLLVVGTICQLVKMIPVLMLK